MFYLLHYILGREEIIGVFLQTQQGVTVTLSRCMWLGRYGNTQTLDDRPCWSNIHVAYS